MWPAPYRAFLEAPRLPSPLWAWLPGQEEAPAATSVMKALTARFGPELKMEMAAQPLFSAAAWEMSCTLGGRQFSVWAQPNAGTDALHFQKDHRILSDEERRALDASRWCLGVVLTFGDEPLDDFHFQLRALAALAPSGLAAFDAAACRLHHFEWVKASAASAAPPSPASLFVMHYVGDGTKAGWLHTHGLQRCGSIELEMFDVGPDDSGLLAELLNSAAAYFLEAELPPPGEPVFVGRDLPLLWLPWEEALSRSPPRFGGGRDDRDDAHGLPSGVLFAPGKKVLGLFGSGLASPAVHRKVLDDSPILYVSNAMTRRMEILSREKLPVLQALFARLGANEHFRFLVKLGYPTVDATHGEREHLWFHVHRFDGAQVEATCINSPHAVPSLHEGHRGTHALALMSDWTILSPLGRFDAERVGVLVHALEQAPPELLAELGLG